MADEKQDKMVAFEKRLGQLETDLDRLRALYDQYFVGIEKREPLTFRNRIGRVLRDERPDRDLSTSQRFRFRTLMHRFSSYCAYWDRISRLIEMGTYDRDRNRNPMADHPVLRRRAARMLGPRDRRALREAERKAAAEKAEAEAAPPATPEAKPNGVATFGRSEADRKLRTLYMDYVRARRATGESIEGLSYPNFKQTVLKTRDRQMERLSCPDINFRVEIRAGRASLIAQPVRNPAAPDDEGN